LIEEVSSREGVEQILIKRLKSLFHPEAVTGMARFIASMHVLEKAGYPRECQLRKSAYKNGEFVNQVLYTHLVER
jgi:hypothetical protein